ncbi:ABC transporter substrate-binding protein [Bradyrhizobium sp. WSM3983]|uniref:ABC transporter substrate-binding protein n=1 Tax=Bradyrhizobium sp. WSM3983 TaxID=1038867 RepID=UPI0012EB3664|nr:ABC transporter substrate-binding protein [Bradyrhizobium sp. WSM3983]
MTEALTLRTAAMRDGYPDDREYKGTIVIEPSRFNALVATANRYGWRVGVHAVGDTAIDRVLDAYELADAERSIKGRRFIVIHGSLMRPDQMQRAKLDLRVDAQTSFLWDKAAFVAKFLGKETADRAFPMRTMIDIMGLNAVGQGTDYPINLLNPFANKYVMVTRRELFSTEAAIYARLVSETIPRARIAVLYQNDDYGREYLRSFKAELAWLDPQAEIVATAPYEVTSPTVDSQVVSLASTDANVFLNASTGKFTSQAIRKAGELGWHAQQFLPIGSNFVATTLKPAGLENAKGAISATPTKTVGDPEWAHDPAYLEWLAFMKKYYPEGDIEDQLNFTGWNVAVLMTKVIEACGSDLSPQNLMKQATALKNVTLPGLIPGITVNTIPDDYCLIKSLRPQRFDGERWVPIFGTMAAR